MLVLFMLLVLLPASIVRVVAMAAAEKVSPDHYQECGVVDPSTRVTYPDDYGWHTNTSYEYIWLMGVLTVDAITTGSKLSPQANAPNVYGYLIGLNRCSANCTGTDNKILVTVSLVNQQAGTFVSDTFYVPDNMSEGIVDLTGSPVASLRINSWLSTMHVKVDGITSLSLSLLPLAKNIGGDNGKVTMELEFAARPNTDGSDARSYTTVPDLNLESMHMIHPSMPSKGFINGQPVRGSSFIDHFWGPLPCHQLLKSQWSWFFLQLDNGFQIMAINTHTTHSASARKSTKSNTNSNDLIVSIIAPGASKGVEWNATYVSTRNWTSPRTGIVYPLDTTIVLLQSPFTSSATDASAKECVILCVSPLVDDNEFTIVGYPLFYEGPSLVKGEIGTRVGDECFGSGQDGQDGSGKRILAGTGTSEFMGFSKP